MVWVCICKTKSTSLPSIQYLHTVSFKSAIYQYVQLAGQVPEWLKGPVLKTGIGLRLSWVRIPPCPPEFTSYTLIIREIGDAKIC